MDIDQIIFKKVVESAEPNKITQRTFQSRGVELFFKDISKTGLPTSYDKRQVFKGLNFVFQWVCTGTKHRQLYNIFSDDKISNEVFNELVKQYSHFYFNKKEIKDKNDLT